MSEEKIPEPQELQDDQEEREKNRKAEDIMVSAERDSSKRREYLIEKAMEAGISLEAVKKASRVEALDTRELAAQQGLSSRAELFANYFSVADGELKHLYQDRMSGEKMTDALLSRRVKELYTFDNPHIYEVSIGGHLILVGRMPRIKHELGESPGGPSIVRTEDSDGSQCFAKIDGVRVSREKSAKIFEKVKILKEIQDEGSNISDIVGREVGAERDVARAQSVENLADELFT